jgi:2-iminoacetate synthase
VSSAADIPEWLDCGPFAALSQNAGKSEVHAALSNPHPDESAFAALISPAAVPFLETMAQRAKGLTQSHFGRTISLYAPLYLSNYCPSGCSYCGFASDRQQLRHRLSVDELRWELEGLKERRIEDVLLLTGERCRQADFEYLLACVEESAKHFHLVGIESFAMTGQEYGQLENAGCTGVTLYQETYDPVRYAELHRWGEKQDYIYRLEAPSRALDAGLRTVGIGALLGLADPVADMLAVFRHARHLQKRHWRSGVMVSFPRICHQVGEFTPESTVSDARLVQFVLAFRICLPDVPLVLSTREAPEFRDAMAGIGISRMSVASRTTVGGYSDVPAADEGQFDVQDQRDVDDFCDSLRARGLEPVFKNWDSVYR